MIKTPSDIAKLPWQGCYYSDAGLFDQVDRYIIEEGRTDDEVRQALYLAALHGMGIDEPVPDSEVRTARTEIKEMFADREARNRAIVESRPSRA